MENNQKVLKPVLSSLLLLMEHNQNQQKLEFLWNTKDWPCTCFPVVDHSPAVMIPMTLHDGHHLFRRRNGPKNVDFNSEHWLETPQKKGDFTEPGGGFEADQRSCCHICCHHLSSPKAALFQKKTQDLFHLPFFTIAFLGFPMIFLRSTNGFPMGFQPASRALSKTRPASRSVPRYNWACPWPRGRSCTAMRRFSGFALRWMVVFYGFLCQKRLVVEEHWDKPRNVLKCWKWDTIVPNCWDYNMLIEFTLLLWDMKWE